MLRGRDEWGRAGGGGCAKGMDEERAARKEKATIALKEVSSRRRLYVPPVSGLMTIARSYAVPAFALAIDRQVSDSHQS